MTIPARFSSGLLEKPPASGTYAMRNSSLYNPDLDAIRFIAFIAVFLHHALPNSPDAYAKLGPSLASTISAITVSGCFGVDLFFVLSSYLITRLLLAETKATGRLAIGRFLLRRALRIWPLYFAFLALCVFVVPKLLPGDTLGEQLPWFLCFMGNWSVAEHGYPPSVAAPLWSVSIEEQFYVFWPLALLVFGAGRIMPIALVMLALASATRIWLSIADAPHPAIWTNTLARLDPIAAGIILAKVADSRTAGISKRNSRMLVACGAMMLPALLLLFGREAVAGALSLALYPSVAIACTTVVGAVVYCVSPVFRTGVAGIDATIIWLGRISYGLYVFHVLAISLVAKWAPLLGNPGPVVLVGNVVLALLLTILMAACSYRFLEQPFLDLKRRFTVIDSVPK